MSLSKETQCKNAYDSRVNNAILDKSAGQHNSTFNGVNDAHCQLPVIPKAYQRRLSITDASACVLQQTRSNVQSYPTPQRSSSHSITPFQPCRFLEMPPEIRVMIYELVVGSNQRFQIDCGLINMRQRSETWPVRVDTPLRRSRHFTWQAFSGFTPAEWNNCNCYQVGCLAMQRNHRPTVLSYDLHTNKQQVATGKLISIGGSILNQTRARVYDMQDLRLLRTCREIYDEARPVLYQNNTFEFMCITAFATYFGLQAPDQVHIPRSTEPHRLRALQAMTKVEVRMVGNFQSLDFLSCSRLIRAGLGCLTNLTSFEVSLEIHDYFDKQQLWRIDDYMFSKPPSLKKLVVGVWDSELTLDGLAAEEEQLDIAKELVHRILKQEDFSDMIESFQPYDNTYASTESLSDW